MTGRCYGRMAELVDAAVLDTAGHSSVRPEGQDSWGFETPYAHQYDIRVAFFNYSNELNRQFVEHANIVSNDKHYPGDSEQ